MDKFVWNVFIAELFAGCPYVTIFVAITFKHPSNWCEEPVAPEIEFAFVYEERVVNVLLDDEGAFAFGSPSDDGLNLLHAFADLNAIASIRVFAWFDDPCVFRDSELLFQLLNLEVLVIFRRLSVPTPFAVPGKLDLINLELLLMFHNFDLLIELVVVSHERNKLRVFEAFLGVECQRQYFKGVFSYWVVVAMHIYEDAFFICKLFVLLKFVVHFGWLDGAFFAWLLVGLLVWDKPVDVPLFLPRCPDEIAVRKLFFLALLPPVALL